MLMKRSLGRTGFQVTEMGFGSWAIGGSKGPTMHYGDVSESDAIPVLEAYVEAGGNFIDTARLYNESEYIIGQFLARYGRRKELFIATKTFAGHERDSIPQIREDLETSLRFLKCDYVDVFQLHQPPDDPDVMNRALDEMLRLKEEGKIRATGASIKGIDVTDHTENLCRQYMATGKIDTLQLVYSILRQHHIGVIEEAQAKGIGIIARTALESGLLTGKYKPGQTFSGLDQRSRYKPEKLEYILHAAQEIGKFAIQPPYENLAQVAIKFALHPPGVSALIFGAHRVDSVKRNIKAASLPPLNDEIHERLRREYGDATYKANYH